MFSRRVPSELTSNRLAREVARLRAEGREIVDLTESNPTRVGLVYPADLLAMLSDRRALSYRPQPFGMDDARAAVARDYARQGIRVDAANVALTASTSEAYSLLFKLLADAGDEVLVPQPSYPLFDHLSRLDLVTARPYTLEYHGVWSLDLAAVRDAFTERTRAVLIVTPNNPTGSAITPAELDALCAMCRARGVAVIADEVFADYALHGDAQAWGRLASRDDVLGFSLGGLSKSVGLPQAKLGWIAVSGPSELRQSALERLELICDTYLSVSTPVQIAAGDLLDRGAAVREQIRKRIAENFRWMRSATDTTACTTLNAEGGWSAVLQVPTLETEEDLVVSLLSNDGVLVHPGFFFDFSHPSFLVISLLPAPDTFASGVTRILRHFDCSTAVRHA